MNELSNAEITAILRDHKFHAPECPVRETERVNEYGGPFMTSQTCTCYISQES